MFKVIYRLPAIRYLSSIFKDQQTVTIHQGEFGWQIEPTRTFLSDDEIHVCPALRYPAAPYRYDRSAATMR